MDLTTYGPDGVTEMTDEDCWALLGRNELGHLAFVLFDEVHIVPLNYISDGSRLVFRTAEGTKLFGLTVDDRVAFEVDEIGRSMAHTVIVRGHARRLSGQEETEAEELGLRPWSSSLKYNVMAIEPDEVTGRAFLLERA